MLAERLTAQLLAGPPARDPVAVAERLLAVQGQDPRGVRLAVRARTSDLSAADVNHALSVDRTLIITWLNRGTLHLVTREDYPWLQALTTPSLMTANTRRLEQEGVTSGAAARGVAIIERALADGPQTRHQLGELVAAAGVKTQGQALIHLLMLAAIRGIAVRGPMIDREQAYVLVRDWIGESAPVDRDVAIAELARRYLRGHGPAVDRDLAKWSGLPLRDVRAGLKTIAPELTQRDDGLIDLADREAAAELPPPRLLGAFDAVLLGWSSREFVLGEHEPTVTVEGLFRPFALAGGKAVATWRMTAGVVELQPLEPIDDATAAALQADAHDVERFLADW